MKKPKAFAFRSRKSRRTFVPASQGLLPFDDAPTDATARFSRTGEGAASALRHLQEYEKRRHLLD